MYAGAGWLFLRAVEFYREVSSLNEASISAQRGCLASLVFAAMSTEAFINELQQLAADAAAGNSARPNCIKALGEMLRQAEDSHASTKSKYQLAKFVLTGEVFDGGTQPFQHCLLMFVTWWCMPSPRKRFGG